MPSLELSEITYDNILNVDIVLKNTGFILWNFSDLSIIGEMSDSEVVSDAKQKEIAEMIAALLRDVLGKLDKGEVAARSCSVAAVPASDDVCL